MPYVSEIQIYQPTRPISLPSLPHTTLDIFQHSSQKSELTASSTQLHTTLLRSSSSSPECIFFKDSSAIIHLFPNNAFSEGLHSNCPSTSSACCTSNFASHSSCAGPSSNPNEAHPRRTQVTVLRRKTTCKGSLQTKRFTRPEAGTNQNYSNNVWGNQSSNVCSPAFQR